MVGDIRIRIANYSEKIAVYEKKEDCRQNYFGKVVSYSSVITIMDIFMID